MTGSPIGGAPGLTHGAGPGFTHGVGPGFTHGGTRGGQRSIAGQLVSVVRSQDSMPAMCTVAADRARSGSPATIAW